MKPYMLIQGSNKNLDSFETKVAEALDEGYELAGDLKIQVLETPKNPGSPEREVLFFQSMIVPSIDDEDDDMEDDDEVEYEYEEDEEYEDNLIN